MAKHRGSVFTVVREGLVGRSEERETYAFSGIVGVYQSLTRADEIAARYAQEMVDTGFTNREFRFSVQVGTYYDE